MGTQSLAASQGLDTRCVRARASVQPCPDPRGSDRGLWVRLRTVDPDRNGDTETGPASSGHRVASVPPVAEQVWPTWQFPASLSCCCCKTFCDTLYEGHCMNNK